MFLFLTASKIRYEITGGNIGGAFAVKNETGAIYVAGPLDYESRKEVRDKFWVLLSFLFRILNLNNSYNWLDLNMLCTCLKPAVDVLVVIVVVLKFYIQIDWTKYVMCCLFFYSLFDAGDFNLIKLNVNLINQSHYG